MVILKIALRSLSRRTGRIWISLLTLSVAITLILGLSHLQDRLHQAFEKVSSQADIIVGGPAQPVYLVIYGLFRIGNPPPPIDYQAYEKLKNNGEIESAIPLAFGESHRGITITGTDNSLFESFGLPLILSEGEGFANPMNAILGASVAKQQAYKIGEQLTIAAGFEPTLEDEYPELFTISGILSPTGTYLDNTILVHLDGLNLARASRMNNPPRNWTEPGKINLVLSRLHDRQALFAMEMAIKAEIEEPVEAVIPSRELASLFSFSRLFSNLMLGMAGMTLLLALITVFFNVSASLAERRSEIEMLRMLGARPWQVTLLGLLEPMLLIFIAMLTGTAFYLFCLMVLPLWLPASIQNMLQGGLISLNELSMLLLILAIGSVLAAIPAWRTYGSCNSRV
ncbi:MAG: ABC transporter permease [Endozoicomonas sp.]